MSINIELCSFFVWSLYMHVKYKRAIHETVIFCGNGEEYACTITGHSTLKPVRLSLADTEVENVRIIWYCVFIRLNSKGCLGYVDSAVSCNIINTHRSSTTTFLLANNLRLHTHLVINSVLICLIFRGQVEHKVTLEDISLHAHWNLRSVFYILDSRGLNSFSKGQVCFYHSFLSKKNCIWPPGYKINTRHKTNASEKWLWLLRVIYQFNGNYYTVKWWSFDGMNFQTWWTAKKSCDI